MPPKRKNFADLPNAAQNEIVRRLNLDGMRALERVDARWKPIVRHHIRRYKDAIDAVKDARRLRENAIVERAALQRRRNGLAVVLPIMLRTHHEVVGNWWNRQREMLARALLDHMRTHPELGRRLYRDVVREYREAYPGCIVNFVEFDPTGWYAAGPEDIEDDEHPWGEASVHVYFVTADGAHRVQWSRYKFEFKKGTWEFGMYDFHIDPDIDPGEHLPYLLLPTGKVVRVHQASS
jgi:hypothetical protein